MPFDFNNNETNLNDNITCPVGIRNSMSIEHLDEKMTIMIEQISKDTKDIKKEVKDLSTKIDNVNTNLENKIGKVEKSIPDIVDKKIAEKKNVAATMAWRYIFVGVGGSLLLTIVTKLVTNLLGL